MLREALESFEKNLVSRIPGIEFAVHCYVQDEPNPLVPSMFPNLDVTFTNVPKSGSNIGAIVRRAYDATVQAYPSADFYILSDDDVLVVNEDPEFGAKFNEMLVHMLSNEVQIGSAKIGSGPFSHRAFPQDEKHTPFKERFIIFQGQQPVIMNPEIDELSVGEDLFIFVKGVINGSRIELYEGILDYWHLPHMEHQRETSKLVGGFTDKARDVSTAASGEVVTEENKYRVVAKATNSTVQDRFDDLFNWGVVNDILNPLRDDVVEYVKRNWVIDAGLYTQRTTNFRLFREKNIRALADAIQGDEYDDMAQYTEKLGNIHEGWIEFVRRNVQQPMLECGPGRGLLVKCDIVAQAFIEPSRTMIKGLTQTLAEKFKGDVPRPEVVNGVIECIPNQLTNYGKFGSVVFLNGFFQVRSDYEALIEVNHALRMGGVFIFNLYTDDQQDIVCGRVLGANNYLRIVREFGFDVREFRPEEGLFCIVKVREFDMRELRKLQLVRQPNGMYVANNFLPQTRDQRYV
jgi:hypothetical protein